MIFLDIANIIMRSDYTVLTSEFSHILHEPFLVVGLTKENVVTNCSVEDPCLLRNVAESTIGCKSSAALVHLQVLLKYDIHIAPVNSHLYSSGSVIYLALIEDTYLVKSSKLGLSKVAKRPTRVNVVYIHM